MEYITSEIMALVEKVIGKDADGIYASWSEIEYGSRDDIYTSRKFDIVLEDTDDYEVRRGVTKVVIIPVDKPYVVKMNITHVYENDSKYYGEIVQTLNPDDDSIKYEQSIYSEASELLKTLLVENIYVGKFNNLDIYIQEKMDFTFSAYCGDPFSDSDKENEIYEWYNATDYEFKTFGLCLCEQAYIAGYTKEEIMLLDDELYEFGVSDLHNGNLCVDMNGNMRILDYAGYDEYEHWIDEPSRGAVTEEDEEEDECEIKELKFAVCD